MANNIGDVEIQKLIMLSPENGGTSLDLVNNVTLISFSIYESIFTPGTLCDITINDTNDYLGKFRMSGGEPIDISFRSPSGKKANYRFILCSIENLRSQGAQKGKTYTLKCVTEESLIAQSSVVKKIPMLPNSEIINLIHTVDLRSKKRLDREATKGMQWIDISDNTPFDAIKIVRQSSISNENKSSLYCYFECRENEETIYRFRTIESMFQKEPIKKFYQSDAISTDFLNNKKDSNILSYKVNHQVNAMDRIKYAVASSHINKYENNSQIYKDRTLYPLDKFKDGSSTKSSSITDYFILNYGTNLNPRQETIYVDESRPLTYITENISYQKAYIALMLQNTIKIRVPGDSVLTAGNVVNCSIPTKNSDTGNKKDDPLLSGNFLISRIHHRIGEAGEAPRYTCILELIKGKYNEGVNG
jgi:hypothetical protein